MPFVPRPTQTLKLACPPFKPIFPYGGRRVPGTIASRVADFSGALQARYGGRAEGIRSQGLVFRRASLSLFLNRIYRPIQLTLTPRLQLSFQTRSQKVLHLHTRTSLQKSLSPLHAAPLSLPSFPIPALKPAAISIWRRGAPAFLEEAFHPLEIQRAVEETSQLISQIRIQMVQRVAARLERVETVRPFTPAAAHHDSHDSPSRARFAQPLPMALPIPQVTLHRTQAVRLGEDQPPAPRSQHAKRRQTDLNTMAEFTPFSPTDMNIHRLADQVVQVINDRVTARHERNGRF